MATKVYAVAESVPERIQHLTAGKRYEVMCEYRGGFQARDDYDEIIYANWNRSDRLDGGNWARIEEEGPTPEQTQERAVEALEAARQFITNGIEFGYIRMPDADTPDSAHDTLPLIEAALSAFKKSEVGHG